MTNAIDIGHLEKYVFGDKALLDEILTIFIDQAEMLLARFDADMAEADWRMTAHTLKGASRGIGAWALGDLAEAAENYSATNAIGRSEMIRNINAAGREAIAYARKCRETAS